MQGHTKKVPVCELFFNAPDEESAKALDTHMETLVECSMFEWAEDHWYVMATDEEGLYYQDKIDPAAIAEKFGCEFTGTEIIGTVEVEIDAKG